MKCILLQVQKIDGVKDNPLRGCRCVQFNDQCLLQDSSILENLLVTRTESFLLFLQSYHLKPLYNWIENFYKIQYSQLCYSHHGWRNLKENYCCIAILLLSKSITDSTNHAGSIQYLDLILFTLDRIVYIFYFKQMALSGENDVPIQMDNDDLYASLHRQ